MKKTIMLVAILLSGFKFVEAANTTSCVNINPVRGELCNSAESLTAKATNNCPQRVYVKVCLEAKTKRWSCGSTNTLDPGETRRINYVCSATGKYEWDSCTGGSKECGFKKK